MENFAALRHTPTIMVETDELGEQIGELTHALDEHREEMRVVRDAIDELREVIDHMVRQLPDPTTWIEHLRRVTSMPLDPAAPDFHQRVNTLTPADLPDESLEASPNPPAPDQQTFWMTEDPGS